MLRDIVRGSNYNCVSFCPPHNNKWRPHIDVASFVIAKEIKLELEVQNTRQMICLAVSIMYVDSSHLYLSIHPHSMVHSSIILLAPNSRQCL